MSRVAGMPAQKFLRVSLDAWFALAAAVVIIPRAHANSRQILIAIYLMICSYVLLNVFTDDWN